MLSVIKFYPFCDSIKLPFLRAYENFRRRQNRMSLFPHHFDSWAAEQMKLMIIWWCIGHVYIILSSSSLASPFSFTGSTILGFWLMGPWSLIRCHYDFWSCLMEPWCGLQPRCLSCRRHALLEDVSARSLYLSDRSEHVKFITAVSSYWYRFHVDKLSSAHVYLRMQKGQTMDGITADLLEDCAQLVKANSIQGRFSYNILVLAATDVPPCEEARDKFLPAAITCVLSVS